MAYLRAEGRPNGFDLSQLMDHTAFTGTTVQEALDQGYLYFMSYTTQGGVGTVVYIDDDGQPDDLFTSHVVTLQGVLAEQLDLAGIDANVIV